MPKRTIKYMAALRLAAELGIKNVAIQELLYRDLQERGYLWDAQAKDWELISEQADPPTQVIRVRVWAETKQLKPVAAQMINALNEAGFELLEQSEPYVCRPPKQLESRVYLTFREKKD